MSDQPSQPDVSAASLQRIDWLAITPWTLLFRVPGIAFGKPFFFGLIGSLFLGCYPEQVVFDGYSLEEIFLFLGEYLNLLIQLPAKQVAALGNPSGWKSWGLHTLWFFAWAFLGLCITDHASRKLTKMPSRELYSLLKNSLKRLPTVGGVFAITITISILLSLPLLIVSWMANNETLAQGLYYLFPVVTLGLGIPLFLLLVGIYAFTPLALSATVVDQADPFDATSRLFAYTYQKFFRLIGYLALASLLGVLGFYLAVVLFGGTELVLESLLGKKAQHVWLQALLYKIPFGYACGYFYTAASAIYLLRRQDIDNQPIDEMAV